MRMNRITETELLEIMENLSEIGDPSDMAVFEDDFWAADNELLKIERSYGMLYYRFYNFML